MRGGEFAGIHRPRAGLLHLGVSGKKSRFFSPQAKEREEEPSASWFLPRGTRNDDFFTDTPTPWEGAAGAKRALSGW
jgi:hypothetical protein